MTLITEKFFIGCKKMKYKEELKKYKEKAHEYSELPLRGNTHISGTEFKPMWVSDDSEDVYVVHYDKQGNRLKFAKKYIIERNGKVYTLRKNGSKNYLKLYRRQIYLSLNEPDENGKKTVKPQQTFLQITSYFANHGGWDIIMQNRGKKGSAHEIGRASGRERV